MRKASDARVAAIQGNFPEGIVKPALRALLAAGLTTLEHLPSVSQAELAELHGMGPKAVESLKAALRAKGLGFRC